MNANLEFWRGRRCIVTGAIGFLGSHLCARLSDLGASIVAVDREFPGEGTLYSLLNSRRDIEVIQLDLALPAGINVISNKNPDVIFHLAAEPYAPFTSNNPNAAYFANVVSTVNSLEAARICNARTFVLASSACVFGAVRRSPLKPNSKREAPEHYYTITKREAETQAQIYSKLYGIRSVICRFGNIYGPGDRHFGRIVPRVCREILVNRRGAIELKRSNGKSIFEFLFVSDAVEGMILSVEKANANSETFQFSGGKVARKSIRELALVISEKIDGKLRPLVLNTESSEQTVIKYLDTADAQSKLNWKTKHSLDSGLQITIEWYREFIKQLKPREV